MVVFFVSFYKVKKKSMTPSQCKNESVPWFLYISQRLFSFFFNHVIKWTL